MNSIRIETARFFTYFGSLATDPICSAHKRFIYSTLGKNKIYPESTPFWHVASRVFSLAVSIPLFVIGVPAGAIGIASRFIANLISSNPFVYKKGNAKEKPEKNNSIIFKWNICGIGGGYPTYQNGLKPWDERLDDIVAKVKSQNADIVFLEEVYDYKLGLKLYAALKNEYTHFYFNIGAKAIGAPGALLVASKIPITNPNFISFPAATNVGRIKFVGKGLFSFDSGKLSFHHTHFQHSEDTHNPSPQEISGRKKQASIVLKEILNPSKKQQHHVFLGDLNMTSSELKSSPLLKHFQSPPNLGNCSYFPIELYSRKLKEKKAIKNQGSFIDYILLELNKGHITTKLVKAFSLGKKTISDHHGLRSTIKIGSVFQRMFS